MPPTTDVALKFLEDRPVAMRCGGHCLTLKRAFYEVVGLCGSLAIAGRVNRAPILLDGHEFPQETMLIIVVDSTLKVLECQHIGVMYDDVLLGPVEGRVGWNRLPRFGENIWCRALDVCGATLYPLFDEKELYDGRQTP